MLRERYNAGWMLLAWVGVALLLTGFIWLGAYVVQLAPGA
jgi:hypothetical protein